VSVGTSGISATFDMDRSRTARDAIRALLLFLEDRRVLYALDHKDFYAEKQRSNHESVPHVIGSVLEIRRKINETLGSYEFDGNAEELLLVMQEACRKLLDSKRDADAEITPVYETALGQIRLIFGLAVGALATRFSVILPKNLKHLAALAGQTQVTDDVS